MNIVAKQANSKMYKIPSTQYGAGADPIPSVKTPQNPYATPTLICNNKESAAVEVAYEFMAYVPTVWYGTAQYVPDVQIARHVQYV